ncbi:MAG TPA: MmcQ/YjbR family DNA-binding protein [Caulobacteraceae bacterium]|nr:MmcQ/YjbR family DNA-binding protein [Caulobacteraceae bacterium]
MTDRFEEVRAAALALPEAIEADHHGFPSFRVGGKIFATLRREPARLMVKLDAEDQHNFCAAQPDIVSPVAGYWGRKGSTLVDYARAEPQMIGSLLRLAWSKSAPERLRAAG